MSVNIPSIYGSEPGDLATPPMTDEDPAPGKRVRQSVPEYEGTQVHHALYLPTDWVQGGSYPVIVEYTGNRCRDGGGTVAEANLGFGMTGGEGFLWVNMPYVSEAHQENEVTWWGDRQATIDYCTTNLPRICEEWGGDQSRIIVCGFSRGAIATSYIGLADDEIASFWAGMFTFDHFDGSTQWGYPEDDQDSALARLSRLKGRPVLIAGQDISREKCLEEHRVAADFSFLEVPVGEIFEVPGGGINDTHTDMWMHRESEYRQRVTKWLASVSDVSGSRGLSPSS